MSLKEQAASGVKWTGAATAITTGVQLCQVAVLARLLSPSDFGLVGMLLVIVGFAQAFADMGISNAIIYRQDATRQQLSSLYWLNLIAGIAVFFLVWASTPLIVRFYREPRLANLVFWVALTFLITPVGQQFQILLQKQLRFSQLARIEVAAAAGGATAGISTAILGHGVFALIWSQLAYALVKATSLAGLGWRTWPPALRFRLHDLRGYLGFGLYQMGERSVNYFMQRLDHLLVGLLLGAKALGYYTLAFNLVIQPVAKLNPIVTRVAFPVFAKVQNEIPRLRRGYMQVVSILSMTNFPLLIGLAVLAPLFVPVVFGEQWLPSVVLLEILAFVSLLRSQLNPVGSLLLARGRADLGFRWNAAVLCLHIPGIYLGARVAGVTGVAAGLLILQALYTVLGYSFLIRVVLGRCAREYIDSSFPALWMSLLMGVSVLCLRVFLGHAGVAALWTLVLAASFGGLIYLLLVGTLRPDMLREIRGLALGGYKQPG